MRHLKTIAFIGLVVTALVLSACGANPTTAPATQPPAAKPFGQAACAPNCKYADMTMCFPQLGAESDWRTADTASFKDEAAKDGFKLVFSDAQQKQENQISAVRACIQQGVSVIALPPVVEDGWDAVLTEAKNAGIPVIIVDRSVSADTSLYMSHIGSDMVLEGQRAAAEFNKKFPNITVEVQEMGYEDVHTNLLNAGVHQGIARCGTLSWPTSLPDGSTLFSLRPECIRAASQSAQSSDLVRFRAKLLNHAFHGATELLRVQCEDGQILTVRIASRDSRDEMMELEFSVNDAVRVRASEESA